MEHNISHRFSAELRNEIRDDGFWTQQGAGWWTRPAVGGICRERNGWVFWAVDSVEPSRPFRTLRAAMEHVETLVTPPQASPATSDEEERS